MLAASFSAQSSASTRSVPEFYRKLLLKMVTDGRSVGKGSQVLAVGRSSASHPVQAATMAQKSHGCLDCATAMMLVAGSHPGRCWGGDRGSHGHAVPVLVVVNNPGQGHAVWWSIPKPHQSGAVGPEHHPRRVQGGENGG